MLKTLVEGCEPIKGSKFSAGVDLYASEDCIIGAGETKIIGLGVCIDLEVLRSILGEEVKDFIEVTMKNCSENTKETTYTYLSHSKVNKFSESHYLELHPQNSIRAKGLISGVEIIGLDFEDEIKIIIHNPLTSENLTSDDNRYINDAFIYSGHEIKRGEKIAQILLKEHKSYLFGIKSDEDRIGGFGSTGK